MFRAGNLTHVVFVKDAGDAEGDARRLDRIVAYRTDQCAGLEVVGVGWVEACARAGSMVGVAKYVVDEEAGGRRGMPPRLRLEDDGGPTSRKRGRIRGLRREIARIKTVQREQSIAAWERLQEEG